MIENEKHLIQVQVPKEVDSIEELDKSMITLKSKWSFWENYDLTQKKDGEKEAIDYNKTLNKIFSFDDIISFWQFYNKYPGENLSNILYNGTQLK